MNGSRLGSGKRAIFGSWGIGFPGAGAPRGRDNIFLVRGKTLRRLLRAGSTQGCGALAMGGETLVFLLRFLVVTGLKTLALLV